jgi:hypothetical protein
MNQILACLVITAGKFEEISIQRSFVSFIQQADLVDLTGIYKSHQADVIQFLKTCFYNNFFAGEKLQNNLAIRLNTPVLTLSIRRSSICKSPNPIAAESVFVWL